MDNLQEKLEEEVGVKFGKSTYLGDGVYAFHTGTVVVLTTVRHPTIEHIRKGGIVHWIALEPSMISTLVNFTKQP